MGKNKYQISLWEDYVVAATDSIPEHFEEKQICIIGSDIMTSQIRVVEPRLVQNINGTNTLTFKLFYTYIDNETGERVKNPFVNLLVNERKVKCLWNEQWYDFIIKGIQEDSSGKSITYTCTDLYVNELSKTGFNLEFDDELNNNQGSVQELAQKIVKGTDWAVDLTNSDKILQTIEEPLYEAKIINGNLAAQDKNGQTCEIPVGAKIYVFYSVVQDKENYFQFIYNDSYETEENSQRLSVSNCYSFEIKDGDAGWVAGKNSDDVIVSYTINERVSISSILNLSDYRGERLVRQQLTEFNEAVGRYCYVFTSKENPKILGYSTVEYKDPTVVLNLIANSKEFTDTLGWQGIEKWMLYPPYIGQTSYTATTYLKAPSGLVYNSGLQNCASYLEDGLQAGQRYFLRVKAFKTSGEGDTPTTEQIGSREENKIPIDFAIYDTFNSLSSEASIPVHNETSYCRTVNKQFVDDWIQLEIECISSIPRAELTAGYFANYGEDTTARIAKPGIFITFEEACWIQEVQFYQKVEGYNGKIIHLGDLDTQSVGATYYKYFVPDVSYKEENGIKYLYYGTEKQSYEKVYETVSEDNPNGYVEFEKIRSISGKNSNRFNLLQTLAETFECWVRFKIEHDENGRIVYEGGVPKKTIYFRKDIGKELGYGFEYGIDLKTISRSIDSNQIATKVIVSPNVTEYAEDGVCEVAKSQYNENGENYILNFDYYINQGLLNGGEFNKYLYLTRDNGQLGFYPALKEKNSAYNSRAIEIAARKNELSRQSSLRTVYDQYVSSAGEQITSLRSQLAYLAGLSEYDFNLVGEYISSHPDNTNAQNLFTTLINTEQSKLSYEESLGKLEVSVSNLTSTIEEMEKANEQLLEEKAVLEEAFYKKFSRFIQEGSWTSQDYLDENLYYLDARSVAYTSSRPKISYNISVIRLSALQKYKGKVFEVGDISYVQDTDFFGYIEYKDGWQVPYKEKVLISEKTSYFDSPEKDSFTIQNYKTQFEDLFQRITATTQSLQYSSGEYQRAANIVEGKGIINSETLQNSISINNQLVFSSQNEEIFQDSTGLTLTDKNDPSKKTKLTSGGLFISTDGGVTWKNAVRGEGIATQYLTAGAINVNNISIYDGNNPTFRWDTYGLTAYSQIRDENEKLLGIDKNTFVRFDRFGIYGIRSGESADEFIPISESEIKDNANFGMTWSGFFLRNTDENGMLEVSSENDIRVLKDGIDRVKIGRLGDGVYGLQLKDDTGATTLETNDSGELWLRDRLSISTSDSSFKVGIGNLGKEKIKYVEDGVEKEKEEELGRVIDANGNFIVYEDGSVSAKNGTFSGDITGSSGTFSGRIEATEGRIGGLEIIALTTKGESFATITESGLILNNGSFSIVDEGGPVFYADQNGNLVFKGTLDGANGSFSGELKAATGSFSGELTAATGSFSGDISAASGLIGGFVIGQDALTSTGTTTIEGEEIPNIVLYGTDGKIFARNIVLGESATIEKNITLGQAKIWNPEENQNGYFLQAGDNVYLTQNGKMSFGSIEIDGSTNDPTITGKDDGITCWKIDKNRAVFKNVTASGGTIENVIFKKSTIQASSGAMIFKPAATGHFEKVGENNYFYFEDSTDGGFFKVGDRVLLSGASNAELNGNQSSSVVEATIMGIINGGCSLDASADGCNTIIKLYSYDSGTVSDDLLIGVNSTTLSEDVLNTNHLLFKEGFTFTAPELKDGKVSYPSLPKLFIGNLAAIDKTGYGLYADNVYLNGTVTTVLEDGEKKSFAGINTISGYSDKEFGDKIVFWAGAAEDSEIGVQNSPFIVTDTGRLFASDGYFSKSVFVESEIRGTDIYTARLHGTGNEADYSVRQPALIIYNTSAESNGIEFRTEDTKDGDGKVTKKGKSLFRICGEAFDAIKADEEEESAISFIRVNNGIVDFSGNTFEGNSYKTNLVNNERLRIEDFGIVRETTSGDGSFTPSSKIGINLEDISFEVNGVNVLQAKNELIVAPKNLSAGRNVTLGDSGMIMEYRKVDGGYDLYIHDVAETNE